MRTISRKRIQKHILPQKMKRRRKFNKNSNFMFDSKIRDDSTFNLETMNEVLRIHKTARAEGKGSWKLMPKDSREVYKKRQQRETNRQSDSSDMQVEKPETREKRRPRRQAGRKVKKTAGKRSRKKHKERCNDSSVSFSSRSTTNSISSVTSYSDMDYE